MPQTKDVQLLEPFEHHGTLVTAVRLKEPNGGTFSQLGEPRLWIRNAAGGYWVEQTDVIRQYMDRCLDHQDGAELLKLMGLSDAMQMKDALLGFFVAAEARLVARSLAPSSSASAA